jgi:hypothetical protein
MEYWLILLCSQNQKYIRVEFFRLSYVNEN